MTGFRTYVVFFAAVVVVSCLSLTAWAQSPGDIQVTTKTEMAVPGHLLEPGTYIIRRVMADTPSVYEITTANGRFICYEDVTPIERTRGNGTVVDVSAPDGAGVRVLQAWYNAGNNDGYQLVYSRRDMRKLDQIAELRAHSSGYAAGQP